MLAQRREKREGFVDCLLSIRTVVLYVRRNTVVDFSYFHLYVI